MTMEEAILRPIGLPPLPEEEIEILGERPDHHDPAIVVNEGPDSFRVIRRFKTYRYQNAGINDEMFFHVLGRFNVSKARRLIEQKSAKYPRSRVQLTETFVRTLQSWITIDETRAAKLPLNVIGQPAVACEIMSGGVTGYLFIDGHHRMWRRWRMGLDSVEYFLIPAKIVPRIRVIRTVERNA